MRYRECRHRGRRLNGNVPAGLILLLIGGVLLARQLGVIFPDWLIRWEMILVVVGLVAGIKSRFQNFGWLILVGIGGFFMLNDYYPAMRSFIWPVVIIAIGLLIILRPHRSKKNFAFEPQQPLIPEGSAMKEDILDVACVFGSTRKIVLSKNFKGGEIVCIFGGTELDLTQADFSDVVKVELVAIFGGLKMKVPSNWEIRSETATVFGGIDDKRDISSIANPEKTIFLEGTVIFGGVEITSY